MTTKTVSVKSATSAHPLAPAVLRQLGGGADAVQNAIDAFEHGADGGSPGFTYYSDTVAFFKRHRAAIVEAVESMAQDLGENPADMVAGFNCLGGRDRKPHLNGREHLAEYLPSVSRCLYGGRLTEDDVNVANALAWFALEEVGRAIADLSER